MYTLNIPQSDMQRLTLKLTLVPSLTTNSDNNSMFDVTNTHRKITSYLQ